MLDHLKRLGIFSVVARTGSFSLASVELGMTPANVSQQIKKLEEWLGVTLIFRSTRHVALSPEGKNLLPFANEVLQSAEAGFRQLGGNESQKGKLTILFPNFLIGSDIHSSINSFASQHPSVLIKLVYQDSFCNIIENGIDLAVTTESLPDSNVRIRSIGAIDFCLCASPSYIVDRNEIHTPDDLKNFTSISMPRLQDDMQFISGSERVKVRVPPGNISTDCYRGVLEAIKGGHGIQVVPRGFATPYLEAGSIVELLLNWPVERRNISVVWSADIGRESLVQLLISHLTLGSRSKYKKSPLDVTEQVRPELS